jgi:RNA-directed DNA polymerase
MAQAAVKLGIAPLLEADCRACAYGFRPKRGAQEAIREGPAQIPWGYRKGIEADLQACFAAFPPRESRRRGAAEARPGDVAAASPRAASGSP